MGKLEKRCVHWEDFIAELESYYEAKDCDVVFTMEVDGSCIDEFTIHPRGKKYFIDKRAYDPEAVDQQAEALAELQRIFFPYEDVCVLEIAQWPGAKDSDIVLTVELDAPAGPDTFV